jgi:hypothetical protein
LCSKFTSRCENRCLAIRKKPIPAGHSDDIGGIKHYFSILNFCNDNGMVLLLIAAEQDFSAKFSPDPAAKIPLASRNKRAIFARQLGDDMAECK